jgi:hypothetical protein
MVRNIRLLVKEKGFRIQNTALKPSNVLSQSVCKAHLFLDGYVMFNTLLHGVVEVDNGSSNSVYYTTNPEKIVQTT